MFWRFGGYANLSSLDSILDKPDLTIEEVLDENDTLQELKSQNAKLIDFLREETVLKRLLKFVTAAPPAPGQIRPESPNVEKTGGGFLGKTLKKGRSKSRGAHDETDKEKHDKQRKKYAYVSCEILSSDVWSISESLLDNTDHMRPFWDYIKTNAPLDNLQAGYFTKVNEALIEKQPARMLAFVRTLDTVVTDMMKHVDCPMIMDLLLKLISLEKDAGGQGIVDCIQTQNLIPILLSYITPKYPAATQTAAGDFLKAIITISANATGQDASVIGPNELTRQLVSEQCINSLIREMLRGGNPLTVGVGIIIEVIRKNNSDYDAETQIGPEPKSSDPIYLGNLLRIFANHVGDFMALILSPSHTVMTEKGSKHIIRKDMKVAWGEKIEPLGFDRFKTCELMAELLHCSNMGLLNEKGSEAEIKRRDAERERLKAEVKLALAAQEKEQKQRAGEEYGTSVDSSGFHHAQAFSPLGESPENIKSVEDTRRPEIESTGEEDGFEKVALSEAMPESVAEEPSDKLEVMQSPADAPDSQPELPEDTSNKDLLDQKFDDLVLEEDKSAADAASSEEQLSSFEVPASSKHRLSMLTQQLQAQKGTTLSILSDPAIDSTGQDDDDKPAPLFAKRPIEPIAAQEHADMVGELGAVAHENESPTQAADGADGSLIVQHELPEIQREDDGSPVLGDLLKIRFVEHHVVPTIFEFFFRFPWNNFLHNVVYDVVQQVFNGAMDRGYNCHVAIDLFATGRITERVIEGQLRSDKAQKEQKLRLGYMGHLTLIAEEIVKFTERQPPDTLAQSILDRVFDPAWVEYVEHTLTETRDRDNAILGGVRPDTSVGPRQAVLNAVSAAQGGFGDGGSAALANAGLGGAGSPGLDSMDLASVGVASGYNASNNSNMLSGFGSSDDEDEDELEESPSGDIAVIDVQEGQSHDEDQLLNDSNTNNSSFLSTPLAVPPSRARRQLAARLADKQRQAAAASSDGVDDSLPIPEMTNPFAANTAFDASSADPTDTTCHNATSRKATSPTAPLVPRRLRFHESAFTSDGARSRFSRDASSDLEEEEEKRLSISAGGGFADDFKGFDANLSSSSSGSDDDDLGVGPHEKFGGSPEAERMLLETLKEKVHPHDPSVATAEHTDDGDDEAPESGSRRQSTWESAERRPLDDGEDSDDGDMGRASPLGEMVSATAFGTSGVEGGREGEVRSQERQAELKRIEQDRLLAEWGLRSIDDEEDDEDEPVEIGRKYFTRKMSKNQ